MKRSLSFLLCFLMLLTLSACSQEKKTSAPTETDPTEPSAPAEPEIQFEEMVVEDNENFSLKVESIDPNGDWGYTVFVSFENKSQMNLMLSVENTTVNDVMFDPFFAAESAPGEVENHEISFDTETLDLMGIRSIYHITMTFLVYDSDDWAADNLLNKEITLYPLGRERGEAYVRTPVAGEITVFDTEDATMIITGTDPENLWGYGVGVYLYNKTDKTLSISAEDGQLNGIDCDPLWSVNVLPGKHAFSTISWFEEDMTTLGIETVEKLWLEIRVSDADDWMASDLLTEEIEFSPF